jgi:protein involved in polysaccharide export with SLBB domain
LQSGTHPLDQLIELHAWTLRLQKAQGALTFIMREFRLLCFLILLSAGMMFSQSINDTSPQSANPSGVTLDCTDPTQANTPECIAQTQTPTSTQGQQSVPTQRVPELRPPTSGLNQGQNVPRAIPLNPSQLRRIPTLPWPETEFEQMVADSAGRPLPLFGQAMFEQPPSTFAPLDLLQVPGDYIIGPGDELQVRIWGQIEADLRVIVDRSGQIYIPRVGQISVAGIHYGELEQHLKSEVSKIFKNFNLTVNVGRLRSIQVLVVGDARYPGTYTIGSLSTLVNAVFASGGPEPQGSLRHIQVRRDGITVTDFDFYDLLIKGDKSKDVRLLPGDVIYFPHVGPLVGISGSVNTPAIYELKDGDTLKNLIEMAGDLSTVADTSKITVDRLADHQARKTLEFPYDDQSRSLPLKDGDIVRVFSVVSRFDDTVTLRGSVANPGRYPWKPGMRVRDLIPDAQALLTRRYWLDRANEVNGRATEYPVRPKWQANPCRAIPRQSTTPNGTQNPNANPNTSNLNNAPDISNLTGDYSLQDYNYNLQNNQRDTTDSFGEQYNQPCPPGTIDMRLLTNPDRSSQIPGDQNSQILQTPDRSPTSPSTARNVTADLRRNAPAINWDYAIIQRVNPTDLTSTMLWMSPRKAILEHDEASNLELQPGDIVTIFSQRDIQVPENERTRYVVIEGEVMRPGVYELGIDETLHSVLERAGGLTPNAYVYGSQLLRESARIEQQKSLDEMVRNLEVQVRQSTLSLAQGGGGVDPAQMAPLQAAQESVIAQLRTVRATGRVSLPVRPSDKKLTDFPDMVLEDSDQLIIPHMPSTVTVVGNVYNPGSFIFNSRTSSGAYLEMAGKGKPQSDLHHAFVLRANGVVVAANNVNGFFTGPKFDHLRMYPGDQIIVPYKIASGAWIRGLRDWTQISSQLAVTGAALAVIH